MNSFILSSLERRNILLFIPETLSVKRSGHCLATVIVVQAGLRITKAWLNNQLSNYAKDDDVFRIEFLHGVIFHGASETDVEVTSSALEFLVSLGTKWVDWHEATDWSDETEWRDEKDCDTRSFWQDVNAAKAGFASGPCAFINSQMLKVMRLVDDSSKAFVTSVKPQTEDGFTPLGIADGLYLNPSIAIPSRLSFESNTEKPLNGWRIAVKDCFQIEGLRMSLCNRAYYQLYPPATETASCIERLIRAGAVIVGTTKLSSMISTEEPIQSVDFQTPWNPRADGYQSPNGSSSGSAAAIASYDWLDIAIGSDTNGSGRRPAHWNGCFGLRPTAGILPNEGFERSFYPFDTPTFLARDIRKCSFFAETWYGESLPKKSKLKPPTSIIYPTDYLPVSNPHQQKIIDDFITDLEASLDLKHTKISFRKLWDQFPPDGAKGLGLNEFMKNVGRNAYWYDDYHLRDKFRADYRKLHAKDPYIGPAVRQQWAIAQEIPRSARDDALNHISQYRKWFSTQVLKSDTPNCTIIVLPIEDISPRYRDEMSSPSISQTQTSGSSTGALFESPATGAPELVVPVGQVPYENYLYLDPSWIERGIPVWTRGMQEFILRGNDDRNALLAKLGRVRRLMVIPNWADGPSRPLLEIRSIPSVTEILIAADDKTISFQKTILLQTISDLRSHYKTSPCPFNQSMPEISIACLGWPTTNIDSFLNIDLSKERSITRGEEDKRVLLKILRDTDELYGFAMSLKEQWREKYFRTRPKQPSVVDKVRRLIEGVALGQEQTDKMENRLGGPERANPGTRVGDSGGQGVGDGDEEERVGGCSDKEKGSGKAQPRNSEFMNMRGNASFGLGREMADFITTPHRTTISIRPFQNMELNEPPPVYEE
ncbi:hypothetical protein B7494_g990 [Chlorociboria aeruginascens]|nr:hypothetical protein B7494_g990 [Chlorociboria aeruginascens]